MPKSSSPLATIINSENKPAYEAYAALKAGDLASNPLEVDMEDDCGYEGGVSVEISDAEYVPGTSSNEVSNGKSLDKYSGDELEMSLEDQCRLLGEFAALNKPSPYSIISEMKRMKEWKGAKQTQALGYDGQLGQTKQRQRKDA